MNAPTKEQVTRAWRALSGRKTRRLALLFGGAAIGALCPYLPDRAQPACESASGLVLKLAALLTGIGG